jgi:hypothetical protein
LALTAIHADQNLFESDFTYNSIDPLACLLHTTSINTNAWNQREEVGKLLEIVERRAKKKKKILEAKYLIQKL